MRTVPAQPEEGRVIVLGLFADDRPGCQMVDEALVAGQSEFTVAREVRAVLDIPADQFPSWPAMASTWLRRKFWSSLDHSSTTKRIRCWRTAHST